MITDGTLEMKKKVNAEITEKVNKQVNLNEY